MLKKKTFVLAIILIYCLLPAPVLAEETPPSPTPKPKIVKPVEKKVEKPKGPTPAKDTYVNSTYPNTNYGQENKLCTAFTSSSKIIFLSFSLEELGEIKADDQVILNLHLDNSTGSLKTIETEILLPNGDWEETELTWNNKPSLYSSGITIDLEATSGARKINLTPLVKQWLDGTTPNRGLAIYHNLESFSRTFFSKENDKNQPYLTLEKEGLPTNQTKQVKTKKISFTELAKTPLNLEQAAEILKDEQVDQLDEKIKGTQTEKPVDNWLSEKNILPFLGLWTTGVSALIIQFFREYSL